MNNNYDPMAMQTPAYSPAPQPNLWGQPYTYTSTYPNMNAGVTAGMPQRLNTNAIFVTSLDEALIKTDRRNSDMIYFNQDKNEFYRVKADNDGHKTWAVFQYTLPVQEDNTPITRADFAALVTRIEALENAKVAPKKKVKEVTENAESDG